MALVRAPRSRPPGRKRGPDSEEVTAEIAELEPKIAALCDEAGSAGVLVSSLIVS